MNGEYGRSVLFAVAAAALFACSTPLSKLLLNRLPPVLLAGLLYLGAGVGAGALFLAGSGKSAAAVRLFSKSRLPFLFGMVLLDILAPVLLLFGLQGTSASGAALLSNFEIVATALFALLLFHESVSRRLWVAIVLITCSSCLLTFDAGVKVAFSAEALFVLLATVCWGLENNCTRRLSDGNPIQIVAVKGLGSGAGSVAIGLIAGERFGGWGTALLALLVGFFAYGLSIACYIRAQRTLGAAKTSAYYAAAPFIGAVLSFVLLGERPNGFFLVALVIMLAGAYLATFDKPPQECK